MKNLCYLRLNSSRKYLEIVSSKEEPRKSTLISLHKSVHGRYLFYFRNRYALERLTKHVVNQPDKSCLEHCYKGATNALDALLTEIKNLQDPNFARTCQYCGIDQAKSIDHYLPKSDFPEFSVYPLNLIPCCFDCNQRKGDSWVPHSNREVLNLYFDDIPQEVFLYSTYRHGARPSMTFVIRFPVGSPLATFDVVRRHFAKLSLIKRYEEASNEVIENARISLASEPSWNQSRRIAHLNKSAANLRIQFGPNYWKAAIYDGLANSRSFLSSI